MQVLFIGVFMFLMRWAGPANYGVLVTALTALVVLLFASTGVAPAELIAARALFTVIGGAIALTAYRVWPTWERTQVPEALARLLDAYRAYFQAVRDAYLHPGLEHDPGLRAAPGSAFDRPAGWRAPPWKPPSRACGSSPA